MLCGIFHVQVIFIMVASCSGHIHSADGAPDNLPEPPGPPE